MTSSNVYVVRVSALSWSAAKTIIQIKAGTTRPLELIRAWIGQTAGETSEQLPVQILRKTAAATVTSFTPLKFNEGDAAANAAGGTAATGTDATVEGTDGDILVPDSWNVLSGWTWLPVPEERIFVPPSGFIALKLPTAPGAALTLNGGMIFREL